MTQKIVLAGLALAFLLLPAPSSAAKGPKRAPGVVESVEPGGAAEKAGLKPGDVLLSWERAASPPANPEPAKGKFDTPFDLLDAKIEQAPRGKFEVSGLREGKAFKAEIPPGKWQVKARPVMAEKKLAAYRKAIDAMETGDTATGAALMRGLADAARKEKDPGKAAWLLFRAAGALEKLRKWDEANGFYAEAAQIAGTPLAQAHIHQAAGGAFKKQNCFDEAIQEHEKALAIREKAAPGSLAVAGSLNNLGVVARNRGDLAAAEGYLNRALAIQEKLAPGSSDEAEYSHSLGNVFKKLGQKEKTLALFRRAVNALETQRGKLGGGSAAAERFSAKYADYFHDLAEMEAELHQKERVFETLERFRGRSLVEILAERDLDFSKDAPADLLLEQKRADFAQRKALDALAEMDPAGKPEEAEKLLARLREARAAQGDIAERIKRASPRLASLQYPVALGLSGAKKAFGPETLFLSYCVGEEKTLLFALLADSFEVYTIGAERKEIEASVRLFRKLAGAPGGDLSALKERATKLYDLLLKLASPLVSRARTLVICPDGPLHALPFGALRTEKGKWLAEEKPVSYTLSATVFAELRGLPGDTIPIHKTESGHVPAALTLAAFGDPAYPAGPAESLADPVARWVLRGSPLAPLPATRREVEALHTLFPDTSETFLGESATEGAVKSLGRGTGVVHFACHGIVDERFPLDSGLALTIPEQAEEGKDNGLLQAWEIFEKMRIDADLVTLSACETGLGKEMGGEGLIGLTRAFQYAGARSVLSSLWSVSDKSTAELMKRFYGYLKEGKPKAEALRLAQMEMIRTATSPGMKDSNLEFRSSDHSHPFYWAGFVLNGD